jgi:hypothetical protein
MRDLKDPRTQVIRKRVAKPTSAARVIGAWKPRKEANDWIVLWRAEK